jgi:hypothetical protein
LATELIEAVAVDPDLALVAMLVKRGFVEASWKRRK